MKQPISMRCTQEQFEAIKPKLEKEGLKILAGNVKELKIGTWYWAGETLFNYQL